VRLSLRTPTSWAYAPAATTLKLANERQ
jgi:hypothetical protein